MGSDDQKCLRGAIWTTYLHNIEIDAGMAVLQVLDPIPPVADERAQDTIWLEVSRGRRVRAEDECVDRGGAASPCCTRSATKSTCPCSRQGNRFRVGERFRKFGNADVEASDVGDWVGVAKDSEPHVVWLPTPLSFQELLVPVGAEYSVQLLRAEVALVDNAQGWPNCHNLAGVGRTEAVRRP